MYVYCLCIYDTMFRWSLCIMAVIKSFFYLYSAFFNEDCEEIVMVLIYFFRHHVIVHVYSHSDLK